MDDPLDDPVRAYYQTRGESEWHRLDNPYEGLVEREMHVRALSRWLPPGGRVLDVGGGPGQWTIWLLRRGHRVVLGDLSPRMLEIARRELATAALAAEQVIELDARDLSQFPGGSFDAVLSMGPLYHLTSAADREVAVREALRVLRPGGLLFATVMTRYVWSLAALLEAGTARLADVRRTLDDGIYRNPQPGRFTEAYLFRSEDITPYFESLGTTTRGVIASQSFLQLVQEQVAELRERDPEAYEGLIELAWGAAADPSILGISNHVLYVGAKVGR